MADEPFTIQNDQGLPHHTIVAVPAHQVDAYISGNGLTVTNAPVPAPPPGSIMPGQPQQP